MKIIDLKIENHSARIYEPENQPKEVLIAVHGFAGDKDSSVIIAVAEDLANYGIATISFELPNHGADACEDVLKLISCVKAYLKSFLTQKLLIQTCQYLYSPQVLVHSLHYNT